MSVFTKLEDSYAVTYHRGLFRQVEVFERKGYLYVKHGSGFASLHKSNTAELATSLPDLKVVELNTDMVVGITKTWKMCLKSCEAYHQRYELS